MPLIARNPPVSRVDPSDAVVAAYRAAWDGSEAQLVATWDQVRGAATPVHLSALIKIDIQARFDRGERPTAARYLELFPDLAAEPDRVLSLVYEEFCLLEEADERPSVGDFCDRYSRWRSSIASQLGHHRKFSQIVGREKPVVRYPGVGERFATYRLTSILGKGGTAQVYLAIDDIGNRKVVLKVSSSVGLEPDILANLEHPNIIPILTMATSEETGLRGICMPYRRGRTLEAVLEGLGPAGVPRRAAVFWEALEIPRADPRSAVGGWLGFPHLGQHTEAIAWLGWTLCNALGYLHSEGVVHRDIKPANILLAVREGPLLFDFNLARSPNAPEYARAALNGGTLPYMAPEQLGAFLDPTLWDQVGAAADIFALGMVLREMATGVKPELPDERASPSRAIQELLDRRRLLPASTSKLRPDIPPSLDAIIGKCLAFRPGDRYASARDVGEDLRRYLGRQPLQFAANPSWPERAVNWVYRQRRLAGGALAASLFGLLVHAAARSDRWPRTPPRPAPVVAQPSTPLASRPGQFDPKSNAKFRRSVELLGSPDQADRIKARGLLVELRREFPRSAWPTLYEAVCIRRTLGNDGRALSESSRLLEQALPLDGAGDAIRQRLSEDDRSADMWVALGHYYQMQRAPGLAKLQFDKARAIDPDHVGALMQLAQIAVDDHKSNDAIPLCRRAIQVAQGRNPSDPNIVSYRGFLVVVLCHQVDELLRDVAVDQNRTLAEESLGELDQELGLIDGQAVATPARAPNLLKDCSVSLGWGSHDSGRGYLCALEGDRDRAGTLFRSAGRRFDRVLELVELAGRRGEDLHQIVPEVKRRQDELKNRMDCWDRDGFASGKDARGTDAFPAR